jgi:SAM-dependent methyltransferase
MSGYQRRASFYRSEFAVRDDFPLLGQLLAGEDGLVVDIPSGAGRLTPVHQAHRRDVIMVDLEPAMIAQCQQAAADCGLTGRVTAIPGDITTWQPPRPAARIIVARGGLQMLPSPEAVTQALTISAANLADGGILYLDVAMPWTGAPDSAHHLAPFHRFTGTAHLEGTSTIRAGQSQIRRSYASDLLADRVLVHFRYQADSDVGGDWEDFETTASWLRIDTDSLLGTLRGSGLTVINLLGDYADIPYSTGSARLVCVAAVQ